MAATARQERELKEKYEKLKTKANDSLELLRAHVLSKGVRSLKELSMRFKLMDYNRDGKIDFHEFHSALTRQGISLDPRIERDCFDRMDTDHSGALNMDEFIVALRPPMPTCRKTLILRAFQKIDKDRSGELTIADLRGVYSGKKHPKYLSGQWTEDQVLLEWLRSFNGPGRSFTGQISYDDFENYYAGVSASIDSDVYFDLMMRQAWKL